MRKFFFLILVASLSIGLLTLAFAQTKKKGGGFSAAASVPSGWYQNSVALVVGISNYSNGWSSLSEPRTDADRVANALSAQGFDVIKLVDGQATREAILRQIQTYIPAKVGQNGRFVFYYSGHGQTEVAARTGRQLGYIVPADGRMLGGEDDWSSYISMDALRTQVNNKIASKHVLIIFDSCFSGTALTKGGSLGGNVDYFLGQPAINVLTAGDAGQPTPDGVFSYDFVNAINGSADTNQDGYVTFAEVGSYLQSQIPAKVPKLSPSFGWWDGTSQMVFNYRGDGSSYSPPPVIDVASDKAALEAQKAALAKQKADLEAYKAQKAEANRIAAERARIVEEQRKLEEERRRIETQKTITAEPPSSYGDSNVVRTSGRFQVTSCGSIIDTSSGLEWYVGSDSNTNWDQARKWVSSLSACGGGWRMPGKAELNTLYQKGVGTRNMNPVFRTSGWWVWAAETRGARDAWGFAFNGVGEDFSSRGISGNGRAFAVRSRR